MYRIILRQDRYGQYQVVLQRLYWIWWGVSFYRKQNLFDAKRICTRLENKFKCKIVKR